ncbi:MOSC domain-containing protein [Pseudooctadecabacter jejudonensis]|uniref:MOSC domain protein n=1 Tax=Pseudooctadecabacter jejudonensis TaxID=1391910 RepID=A0A1Y5RCW8_9RHOB|nr:MOSC domain-containing protein [Pseudooctadecabacter jejudonensis]SLN14486.1 MOSC domain protein [Pseudooctadecabacter jejudonensis]
MSEPYSFADMLARHAQAGRIEWIGLRPARLENLVSVQSAALTDSGLEGDHARAGKRALSLIQAEHLPVIASLAGLDKVAPETLRRNVVISGINLTALRNHPVRIGEAIVEFTTVCAPCSRMEKTMGYGAYSAMRGHGGWCATVLQPGLITVGDMVTRAA